MPRLSDLNQRVLSLSVLGLVRQKRNFQFTSTNIDEHLDTVVGLDVLLFVQAAHDYRLLGDRGAKQIEPRADDRLRRVVAALVVRMLLDDDRVAVLVLALVRRLQRVLQQAAAVLLHLKLDRRFACARLHKASG